MKGSRQGGGPYVVVAAVLMGVALIWLMTKVARTPLADAHLIEIGAALLAGGLVGALAISIRRPSGRGR